MSNLTATSEVKGGADPIAIGAFLALVAGSLKTQGFDLSPGSLKSMLRSAVERDPVDALAATVLGGAYLFYLAERGHNEKVKTYWDALVFVSTNLSVGYADIFARTPAGQAIATALMTFGPAVSGAALEAPSGEKPSAPMNDEQLSVSKAILEKLDAILGVLTSPPRPPSPRQE